MAENWYIILELEFDPNPVHDKAVIDLKIDEKKKFWSKNVNDFNHPEYKMYLEMAKKDIGTIMDNLDERNRLIEEACELAYSPIDKYVKTIGRRGEISISEVQNIVNRRQKDILKTNSSAKWFSNLVTVELVKKRAINLGIKIIEDKISSYQDLYDKYYKIKPQNVKTFDGIIPELKQLGVSDLYEFLYTGTQMKNASGLPCETLRQRANERKNDFKKTDRISTSGSRLCSVCYTDAFKDDSSKKIYDSYLEYIKRTTILDDAKGVSEISDELSEEQGEIVIGQLTELFKDRKLATEVLIAFCKIEKVPYSKKGNPELSKKYIVCRICGITNDVTDGSRTVCQNCGEGLYIKCPNPKCGTTNEASVKVCKCGFKLENVDKAIALCNLAEIAINSMDFSVAEAHLTDAERYWPGSEKVGVLKKNLTAYQQRVGAAAKSMRLAISEKRYYEAKKQYANIQKMFPDFKETDLENEILTALDSAATELKKAQSAKAEKDKIDFCVKAYDFCRDYPGVKEEIPAPLPPSNIHIISDGNTRTNILNWERSPSNGMVYYTVTRKKGAAPINIDDGEVLDKVSSCSLSDSKIEPATAYFYAVFAERAGTHSKPLINSSPAINLFEITNLSITAGDSLLQLEWDPLPNGATVEVYRLTVENKEEKINSTISKSYLDSGLKNDSLYSYVVKLVYVVGGKHQTTAGISISGSPIPKQNPIETLSVKPDDGDTFTAVWSNPNNANVELYCSTEKPTYNYGDLVSQQIIEKKMRRLALSRTSSTEASFQYKGDELLYIVAAIIKSGSVVFGAVARASRGETVKINRIAAVNDKINIYLDPPQGVTGFVVLYRFDKYPDDIGDVKTIRRYIPLKQYLHNSALVIDNIEQKNYYFSVFAEFARDGEKDYSIGSEYLFSNASKEIITYSITVSKKLFGESAIILEFEAENKEFILPDIEIMSGIETAPMFKALAKPFYDIPTQSVNGSVQIKIPLSKGLQRDTYIKAFLKDESMTSTYQLKLKLKSNYKIS